MDRAPSLQLIIETSWRLFRTRGWQICFVMLIATFPITAYNLLLRLDLIPNVFSSVTSLAGDRPNLSEDGWLSVTWYFQKVTIINGVVSVIVFGWLNALASTLCAFIALDWQSEEAPRLSHRIRQLFPAALIVWFVLIITKVCGLVLSAAFVLPALVLGTFWYVATFVAADEKVGPIQSLWKSYVLTRQFIWGVFALVCCFFLISIGSGLLRSHILFKYFLDSGFEVQHLLILDFAFRETFSFVQGFASMIVLASTYLVLKRANLGASSGELKIIFD